MKDIIIAVLMLIILAGLYWTFRSRVDVPVQAHQDSIIVAKKEIKAIQIREKELVARIRQDSARFAIEDQAHKDKAEKLRRHIAAISLRRASIKQLDSTRVVIYSNAGAEGDTLYTMPLDQARDVIAAKAREPVKDSLIAAQDRHLQAVAAAADEQRKAFGALLHVKDQELDKERELNQHFDAIAEHYRKESKRGKMAKWVDRGAGALVGFALGRIK